MSKFYHLVCVREGQETRLTQYPTTHKKCMTIKSKHSRETQPLITVKEVTKQDWRDFAKACDLMYVTTDCHKGRECVIFTYKPDPKVYQFVEIVCFDEDLTIDNVRFMKELGVSR